MLRKPNLGQWAERLLAARAAGGDEFEQGLFRILFVFILLVYLSIAYLNNGTIDRDEIAPALLTVVYLSFGALILYMVHRSPQVSHARHTFTMVTDVAATTACMHLAGSTAAVLYVVYLWLSIGNGFRYGIRYLFLCMALSIVGFGTLLA